MMKRVITYGSFDMLHSGHIRLLERARALGGYLIVGVTSDAYDLERGKLNIADPLSTRIDNLKATGLADEIVIETHFGQKVSDILRLRADIFAIGSDWTGKFDYLRGYCEVVYLPRTRGISSTSLRNATLYRLGIIGTGRIAHRFVAESRYVSGIELVGAYSRSASRTQDFVGAHELGLAAKSASELFSASDIIYIASPHESHFSYCKEALLANCHLLCEKPLVLKRAELLELLELARARRLILREGIKSAYAPAFVRLLEIARSEALGKIVDVGATFTKIEDSATRELSDKVYGGAINELASYPLMAIFMLLGTDASYSFSCLKNEAGLDTYSKIALEFGKNDALRAVATATVGLGAKSEGSLLISGTKGYLRAKPPWWKTQGFALYDKDGKKIKKFYYPFEGDGLRYELASLLQDIRASKSADDADSPYFESYLLPFEISLKIAEVLEAFNKQEGRH